MKTHDQKLIPQTEEDITEVIWVDPKKIQSIQDNTYSNIKLVLQHFLK
jgi:hypothetical protein